MSPPLAPPAGAPPAPNPPVPLDPDALVADLAQAATNAHGTAVVLLRHGFWPIPLHALGVTYQTKEGPKTAIGKEPIGQEWGKTRPTPESLQRLYSKNPGAGVGILLGPAGEVIDTEIDGPEGEESLARLFGGEAKKTMGWDSRRGPHRLLLWDDRLTVLKKAKLTLADYPGVEFRLGCGKQAQSACPPTVGEDGQARQWNGIGTVAPLPESVIQKLLATRMQGGTHGSPSSFQIRTTNKTHVDAWFAKALENEAGQVAMTAKGARHDTLLTAANTLGGLLHHGSLNEEEVRKTLIEAGHRCRLDEEEDVGQTVRDGLEWGKAHPLPWPDKLERPGAPSSNGRAGPSPAIDTRPAPTASPVFEGPPARLASSCCLFRSWNRRCCRNRSGAGWPTAPSA
jgi:hypothetical protein